LENWLLRMKIIIEMKKTVTKSKNLLWYPIGVYNTQIK
jgi:hypothetical protein